MTTRTLEPELLHRMDAYWRAANYLALAATHCSLVPTAGAFLN